MSAVRTEIERIETAGPDRRARRLVFTAPDPEPRLTSASVVRTLGLAVGDTFEPGELEAALAETEPACAWERALRVLGYRERSSRELTRRLHDDGYPPDIVHSVVARTVDLALLDDARFAASWVRSRIASKYGPDRIHRELKEKGVSDQVIADALVGIDPEELVANARAVVGTVPLETRQQRDRAVSRLLRRGFDRTTALAAVTQGEQER